MDPIVLDAPDVAPSLVVNTNTLIVVAATAAITLGGVVVVNKVKARRRAKSVAVQTFPGSQA